MAPSLMPVEKTAEGSTHSAADRFCCRRERKRTSFTPVAAIFPQQPPPAFQLVLTPSTPSPWGYTTMKEWTEA